MSVTTHKNWKFFSGDCCVEHIFFESKKTLYEVCMPSSFECTLRKIPIKKAIKILDTMPSFDEDDYDGVKWDKFIIAWKAEGSAIPFIQKI